jgi:nucleoside-diphosphate-sugar epimerase
MAERILVTGSSGFAGSALVGGLVRKGYQPCVLINSTSSGIPWRLTELWPRVCVHEGNLIDSFSLREQFSRHSPTLVYHLAAFTHAGRSWMRSAECYLVNVVGTLQLVQAITANNNPRFVYVSTSEVYGGQSSALGADSQYRGSPLSPYAASKLAGEDIVRVFSARGDLARTTIIRPFNIYGPMQAADRIIPEAITAALTGNEFAVTSGRQSRDFVYIDDVVDGLVSVGDANREYLAEIELIDFASGMDTSIHEIVDRIFALVGSKAVPRFGELEERPNELSATPGSSIGLEKLLGRSVVSLSSGLERTVEWYKAGYSRSPIWESLR